MDAQKHLYRFVCHALAFAVVLIGARSGYSQNVYKDYVTDECAQYSPFDYQQRGLVYRVHTGHAGIFGNCDDDRQKMVSPYIDWHCRTRQPNLAIWFVRDLFADTFRKSQRVADGAGACLIGRCHHCQQSTADCQCHSHEFAKSEPGIDPRQQRIAQSTGPSARANSKQSFLDYSRRSTAESYADQRVASNQQPSANRYPSGYSGQNANSNLYGSTNASARHRMANRSVTSPSRQPNSNQSFLQARDQNTQARPGPSRLQNGSAYFADGRQSSTRNSVQGTQRQYGEKPTYLGQQARTTNARTTSNSKLVPEDKFGAIEQYGKKQVVDRTAQNRSNSMFKLSSGGVYNRPVYNTAKRVRNSEPVRDQQSDPRYFQFQQIGESKYR